MRKSKIPIDPKLPANFDDTPNEQRPKSHQRWWYRPYIQTETWDDRKPWFRPENKAEWFKKFPSGTGYTVRCLDGGAWDRSTWWGCFGTLEEAEACAARPLAHRYDRLRGDKVIII